MFEITGVKKGKCSRIVQALPGVAILLYLFFIFGHIPISDLCYYLRDTYSESTYTFTIQLIGKIFAATFCLLLLKQLTKPRIQAQKLLVWTTFCLLVAYNYSKLIVFAIEYVHFIQYCLFTVVVFFALYQRLSITLMICLTAGFLDEVYQAYHPVTILNWRDILLNIIGVIWGVLVLWTFALPSDSKTHTTPT